MTANIDVKELLHFCHTHKYKFYPTIIYFVTKVLNKIDNFKMFRDQDENLYVWDKIIPNYTIFIRRIVHFQTVGRSIRKDLKRFIMILCQI